MKMKCVSSDSANFISTIPREPIRQQHNYYRAFYNDIIVTYIECSLNEWHLLKNEDLRNAMQHTPSKNFLSNWDVLSSCYIYNANIIPVFPKRLNYNSATVQELFRQSCYLHNLLPNWVVLSWRYSYNAISLPILSQRLSYNSAATPTTSPRMMPSWYPTFKTIHQPE